MKLAADIGLRERSASGRAGISAASCRGKRHVSSRVFLSGLQPQRASADSSARCPGWKVAALPSIRSCAAVTGGAALVREGEKGEKGRRQAMRGSARRGSEGSEPLAWPRGLAGTSRPVHPGPSGALPLVGTPASEPSRSDTSGPSASGGGVYATPRLLALREPCSPRPQRGTGAPPPFHPFPVSAAG